MKKINIIIILTLFLYSCQNDKSGKVYHPTKINIPSTPNYSININDNQKKLDSNAIPILQYLDTGVPLGCIGDESIIDKGSFRYIMDVAIDKNNNAYLLADNRKEILVYKRLKDFYGFIGQSGRGPGDFESPKSLIINKFEDEEYLYVLDKHEIDVFIKEKNKFKAYKTIKHELYDSWDMCVIDSTLFVSGYSIREIATDSSNYPITNSSKPINRFNLKNGEFMGSFGKMYESESGWPIFTGDLSSMNLVCSNKTETVVSVYHDFPFIYGYSTKGKLKWSSVIKGYKNRNIFEIVDPVSNMHEMGIDYNDDYYHITSFFGDIDGRYIVMQISSRIQLRGGSENSFFSKLNKFTPEIITLLLDSKTGELTKISESLSTILYLDQEILATMSMSKSATAEYMKNSTIIDFYSLSKIKKSN